MPKKQKPAPVGAGGVRDGAARPIAVPGPAAGVGARFDLERGRLGECAPGRCRWCGRLVAGVPPACGELMQRPVQGCAGGRSPRELDVSPVGVTGAVAEPGDDDRVVASGGAA